MKLTKFAKYVWGVLGFNLFVILWGAYVRATGSGAGCGNHWPLCNGEIIPRSEQLETLIEFFHRLTSGAALILVFILLVWALRAYPKGDLIRKGAWLSALFIITEALVGAGLVLFEWVAYDDSIARVISISVHLVNTFLLIASLTLTGWWASGAEAVKIEGRGAAAWAIGIGLLGVIVLGVAGAITALGDTLFPALSLGEGFQQDFSPAAHYIVRLRVWHPIIAIIVGFYLIFMSGLIGMFSNLIIVKRFAWILIGLFGLQLVAGLVNLILLAPVWMQLVHLLLADLVWICLILFAASYFADDELTLTQVDL